MNKRLFEVAKAVSRTSQYPRVKIGCCIVKKGIILAVGTNLVKSHPLQKHYNRLRGLDTDHIHNNIHAELDAIRKCKSKDLAGADVYVYREDNEGNLRMCKPCPACMELIKNSGVKRVHYTDVDGYYMKLIQE